MPRTEYRVVRPDGVVRWVVGTAPPRCTPRTARPRATWARSGHHRCPLRRATSCRAIHDVSRTLAEWDTFGEPLTELIGRIGTAFGWVAGALWTPSENESRLRCRAFWNAADANAAPFEAATRALSVQRGSESLAGRAWSTGTPWARRVREATSLSAGGRGGRGRAAGRDGVPDRRGRAVLGSLEFYGREIRAPERAHVPGRSRVLGQEIGRFLSRRARP